MKILSKIYTGLIFLFLYAPIVVLIIFSFNQSKSRSVWKGFSLRWYENLFRDHMILEALWTSIEVAVIAAIVSTVIGTAAAVGLKKMNKGLRSVMLTLNNIPMVNPDIVTGISMMLLFVAVFSTTGLFRPGFGTLVAAHITFCIPYVILSVLPKLNQMNPSIYEAWHTALSAVYAIYLIVDRENGRQYVGSAYGENGLLGRWTSYVKTQHGNNKRMKDLICAYPERYRYFQFSILQILPKTLTPEEVIETESRFKRKLLSIQYGMNDN